jgi:hypothetical protein
VAAAHFKERERVRWGRTAGGIAQLMEAIGDYLLPKSVGELSLLTTI